MSNKIIKIDYEDAVKNYNNQLVTKLRDFGDNFLDLWVPDDDIIQSLLGILYSVTQNKFYKLELKIQRSVLEKDHDKLRKLFERFSDIIIYETKKDYQIKIDIKNIDELNKINESYYSEKINKKNKRIDLIDKKLRSKTISLTFDQIYGFSKKALKDKNLFFIEKSQLKYYLNDSNYFYSSNKKISFFAKIVNDQISSVKFNCDQPMMLILSNFSKIILNTPIIEAFEHGVMKLENNFRKKNINRNINGVITPLVIKSIFPNLQIIMRDIFYKYLEKNKLEESKNLYDPGLTTEWKKKTSNLKKKSIEKVLSSYSKNLDIKFKFLQIEDDVKVLVDIIEKKDLGPKKYAIILGLEKEIRKKLDKRLEVFYKDEPDNNKLRQKNL